MEEETNFEYGGGLDKEMVEEEKHKLSVLVVG